MTTVTVSGFKIRKGERLYGTYVRYALYKATVEGYKCHEVIDNSKHEVGSKIRCWIQFADALEIKTIAEDVNNR